MLVNLSVDLIDKLGVQLAADGIFDRKRLDTVIAG